jgi:hypothetical protein
MPSAVEREAGHAIGHSRGELAGKIRVVVDERGLPDKNLSRLLSEAEPERGLAPAFRQN